MSVVILGMEMPKDGAVIAIYKLDGNVYATLNGTELYPILPLHEERVRLEKDGFEYVVFEKQYFVL